jgi:putative FmdB family regulatory protein
MPIYEYKCEKCGVVNEFIVFAGDDTLQCKSCASPELTKLMSAHNTTSSSPQFGGMPGGGCCGSPDSCGTPSCGAPGSCCGG